MLILSYGSCNTDSTSGPDIGNCVVDLAQPPDLTPPPSDLTPDMSKDCWELRNAGKDVLACFDFRRPRTEIDALVTGSNWSFTASKFASCTGISMTDVTCTLMPKLPVSLGGAKTFTVVLSHRLTIRRTTPLSTPAAYLTIDGDPVLQWKNGGPYVDATSFVQDRVRQTELPATSSAISLRLEMDPVSTSRGQQWDVEYLAVVK